MRCALREGHIRFSTKWCEHSDSNYNSKRERKKNTTQRRRELFVKETRMREGKMCETQETKQLLD